MTLHFGGVIICLILSALKKIHKQAAYRLPIGPGKLPGYFCFFKLNVVPETMRPVQQ